MKTSSNGSVHCLFLRSALSTGLGLGARASVQERSYLVNLSIGTTTSLGIVFASAINDAGQVAGPFDTADGLRHAFFAVPDGVGMTDLGTPGDRYNYVIGIMTAYKWEVFRRHAFITAPIMWA